YSVVIMCIDHLCSCPVKLFILLYTPVQVISTYSLIILLNVRIFTIAGAAGLTYQFSGMESIHTNTRWANAFILSLLVQIFVQTQMAWVLRPYFDSGPFIRPLQGNFYIALIKLLAKALGG